MGRATNDPVLTRRELARLLRAFACLIERLDEVANDTTPVRSPRRAKRLPEPSELSRARARAALRKLGALP